MSRSTAVITVAAALLMMAAPVAGHAQATPATASVLRSAELRSDKLASAPVLQTLAAGAAVTVLAIEGGWLLVQGPGAGTGWLRASAVNLAAGQSAAAGMASGRQAANNSTMTLGVRSLPARSNRHALIIGISRYADPAVPPLPGARIDRESATQMAQSMQVPASNIRYLQDEQATGDAIRQALRSLEAQVADGDRVFIHFSGHGTRYNDPAAGGCIEALLAHDGGQSGTITNREMSQLLAAITRKTDKLFVMYDACHSGGVIANDSAVRTRGFTNPADEGRLRPKFSSITEECGRPVNVKTRNLLVEATSQGTLPQDIIHISSSRDNEVSFDDELKGGLATQFMRDCMLRDAKDIDGSGAISIDEVRVCAQEKINRRLQSDANFKPHNMVLSGNAGFVPAWFSQSSGLATAPPLVAQAAPAVASVATAPALTGAQALQQMFEQRDAKRKVTVSTAKQNLRIGEEWLDFTVLSNRPGYVYVAMAGSDNLALNLLFPNALDADNRIEADKPLALPRPNWRLKAGGPPGTNNLLVLVTDGPRDLATLAARRVGPFVSSLNDAQGRASLGALMTTDAFGAALLTIGEIR